MPVNLSEPAAREVASIIEKQELDPATVRLRVGVKGGGCSGFSYILDLTETEKDSDEGWDYTYEFAPLAEEPVPAGATNGTPTAASEANGTPRKFTVRVICDPKSYLYLNGATVDFKDIELVGRGFVFDNPNSSATCGCGSSFAV